jgi:PPM family protein phosphatase
VIGSRDMNQDSWLLNDKKQLYAVADGVGGGMNGEVASKMAVEGLDRELQDHLSMNPVFKQLQAAILKEAMSRFGEAIMGTTLTAAMIKGDEAFICHVGDSRCYLFDQSQLRMLTEDQEMFDESIQATVLCSYLGLPTDVHPLKILEEKVKVQPGNKLLMCSDGLYRQITESRIVALIREMNTQPQALVQKLCEEAAQKAYSDNVTVVYVEVS